MDYDRQNTQCDCRAAGTVLGSVGVLTSIGCGLLFTYIFFSMGADDFGLAVAAIAVLNLVASIVWIAGVSKKKTGYLLASLVWWTVPVGVCLLFFFIYIMVKSDTSNNAPYKKDGLTQFFDSLFDVVAIGGTVFCVIFYILAVVCFIKIKSEIRTRRSANQRLGILYTIAPTKNIELDIY